jgi:hypothetical protein
MARKLRIVAWCTLGAAACMLTFLGFAYQAARHVRPFYEQALEIEPDALQRGSRELESRATTLLSDARQVGEWQAIFTAEQINGWLALQLDELHDGDEHYEKIRDPRVAISPENLTLGFRASSGGVDTVVSVDAGVFLTDEGAVAIRLMSVRAGALPLPVMQFADEIADACRQLSLPVRWTQRDGQPVAILELQSDESSKRPLHIDEIKLGEGELYVAGHTKPAAAGKYARRSTGEPDEQRNDVALDEFELRLTPHDTRSALEVARRPSEQPNSTDAESTNH